LSDFDIRQVPQTTFVCFEFLSATVRAVAVIPFHKNYPNLPEHKIVRFFTQCNPTCGGFLFYYGAGKKRLVVTHLKLPCEFRLLGMQEENNDIFLIELFFNKTLKKC
jgi:hypothetical protein